MHRTHAVRIVAVAVIVSPCAFAQLNQNCTVSVLNRTVTVNPDGSWVLPNIPANFGQVKARATCIQNGVTIFGESDFFTVPANGAVNLPVIKLGTTTPVPVSLGLGPTGTTLTTAGQTVQLAVTATYPDSSTKDVTASSAGTNYTTSNAGIASIGPDGLVTAVSSGTVVIQATNDGATGILTLAVLLGGAQVGGLPLSWILDNHLNPNDPALPAEDPDRDGLTNLQEFQLGTDPNNQDTDGDGLTDGDEANKYHTSPLLADTDGDLIPDGVEVQTGTDPLDSKSYDLKKATANSVVTPPSFVLTVNSLSQTASQQLDWKVTLIDGKTTLDLTADPRTTYSSSDLAVCGFGQQPGLIFAGNSGTCVITITQNTLSATVSGTVQSFTPTALSYVSVPGFANGVAVAGGYAFVAAGAAGLQVVNLSADRTNPTIAGSLSLPGNANDVTIAGQLAYVAAGSAGLHIVDITNPVAPVLKGSLNTGGTALDVTVRGTTAYVANQGNLFIADVASPASMTAISTLPLGGLIQGVDVDSQRNLAVVAAGTSGIYVVDISNPSLPVVVGSVSTGDAHDVAIRGNYAYVADYDNSTTSVDIGTPSAPVVKSHIADPNLGGFLNDIVLAGNFALAADVKFVNGIPITAISDPTNLQASAILNFTQRDDNGMGIAIDNSYVYLATVHNALLKFGSTEDSRLYIGQYQQIVDNDHIPPTVTITSPTSGPVVQGSKIIIKANATDDVAVASVSLLVNDQAVFTSAAPPYQTTYTVPMDATTLNIGATAVDYGNNIGKAQSVVLQAIPDPGTTVTGRVVTSTGISVASASVSALSHSGATASDGSFALPNLPTIQGPITVLATATVDGTTLSGASAAVEPVIGGVTNVGDIQIAPVPVITSLDRRSALAGDQATLIVSGANLTGSSFAFQPAVSPQITVQVTSISSDGTSASLSLSIPTTAIGTFAMVATNTSGRTDSNVTNLNRFTVVDPNSTADTDHDSFQDVIEAVFGTDPLDPTSTPAIPTATETESVAFSTLNAPITGAGSVEAESVAFSVLNAPITNAGALETESVAFSILNAPISGAGLVETESVAFSVLNAPVSGSGGAVETESTFFSILNAPVSSGGLAEAENYFSVLNNFTGPSGTSNARTVTERRPTVPPGQGDTHGAPGESIIEIDPLLDTDGDGLPDWFELLIGTDPRNPDTDHDGLTDFEEVFTYHTDPLAADTDGDGFADGTEVLFGSDPLNPGSTPFSVTANTQVARQHARRFHSAGDSHVKANARKAKRGKTAGFRARNEITFTESLRPSWVKSVVPVSVELVAAKVDLRYFAVGDLDARGIDVGV